MGSCQAGGITWRGRSPSARRQSQSGRSSKPTAAGESAPRRDEMRRAAGAASRRVRLCGAGYAEPQFGWGHVHSSGRGGRCDARRPGGGEDAARTGFSGRGAGRAAGGGAHRAGAGAGASHRWWDCFATGRGAMSCCRMTLACSMRSRFLLGDELTPELAKKLGLSDAATTAAGVAGARAHIDELDGAVVNVELLRYPRGGAAPTGRVIEILGPTRRSRRRYRDHYSQASSAA